MPRLRHYHPNVPDAAVHQHFGKRVCRHVYDAHRVQRGYVGKRGHSSRHPILPVRLGATHAADVLHHRSLSRGRPTGANLFLFSVRYFIVRMFKIIDNTRNLAIADLAFCGFRRETF